MQENQIEPVEGGFRSKLDFEGPINIENNVLLKSKIAKRQLSHIGTLSDDEDSVRTLNENDLKNKDDLENKMKKLQRKKDPKKFSVEFIKLKPILIQQLMNIEKQVWTLKSDAKFQKQIRKNNHVFMQLILNAKHLNFIYEYFHLIQFQKCCLILHSYYKPLEVEETLNVYLSANDNISMALENDQKYRDLNTNATVDERMLLFYCTVCALYPSLYATSLSISPLSITNENDADKDELETTSEGLCDFLREIFFLSRPTFNDYQIKALKKLLFRKSQAQVLKEEILKQQYIIENDQHPVYTKDNFQSSSCYDLWKESTLKNINKSMDTLVHVQETFEKFDIEKQIEQTRYTEKLTSFLEYYSKLLRQIFIYLKSINRFQFTVNSKRLLKEFQLRYLIDPFHALITELNFYIINFDLNIEIIRIVNSYLNQIHICISAKSIVFNSGIKNYGVGLNDLFKLMSLLSSIEISSTTILKNIRDNYADGNEKELRELLDFIEKVNLLNGMLNRTSSITIHELLNSCLIDGLNSSYYEMKTKIKKKYFHDQHSSYDLTYSMISYCREQYNYYSNSVAKIFTKYLDVKKLVANVLYRFIMEDIKGLCDDHSHELKEPKVNLNLLALSYRLNQLDTEWSDYIGHDKQDWRMQLVPFLSNWIMSIGEICTQTIVNLLIPVDNYNKIVLNKENIEKRLFTKVGDIQVQQFFEYTNEFQTKLLQYRKSLESTCTFTSTTTSTTATLIASDKSAFRPFKRTTPSTLLLDDTDANHYNRLANEHKPTILNNKYLLKYESKGKGNLKPNWKRWSSCTHLAQRTYSKSKNSSCRMRSISIPRTHQHNSDISMAVNFGLEQAQIRKKTGLKTNPNDIINKPIKKTSVPSSTSSIADLLNNSSKSKNIRIPFSESVIELIVLTFRLNDACANLVDVVLPKTVCTTNLKCFQAKFQAIVQIHKMSSTLVNSYVDNLFVLDVCATQESLTTKLFGKEMITEVFNKANAEHLWGCRHNLQNSKYNCEYYTNRVSDYISDLFEPINEMMCVRLNNLVQVKELHLYLVSNFKIQMQDIYIGFSSSKPYRSVSTSGTALLNNYKKNLKRMLYEQDLVHRKLKAKINKILTGLTNLLVFRFNLFCKKALDMLMSGELDMYSTNARLKPLTDFLLCNFEMFQKQFYPSLFSRILSLLWSQFNKFLPVIHQVKSQNFLEIFMNIDKTKYQKSSAIRYLQMIEVLMNQFKAFGCKTLYLQAKSKKIKLYLQLYSYDSIELIYLFYKLFNLDYRSSVETFQKNMTFLLIDLPHLITIKKKLKKCFTGKFFVDYLRKNTPPSADTQIYCKKKFEKDSAIEYAQTLLDEGYLEAVTRNKNQSSRDISRNSDKYPVQTYTADFATDSSTCDTAMESVTVNLFEFKKIFLATKQAYFKVNESKINGLIKSFLNLNSLLKQEIELLFIGQSQADIEPDGLLNNSDCLLESCVECSINFDFVMNILWQRIHAEPIVMKFISLRYSNYATNMAGTYSRSAQAMTQQKLSQDYTNAYSVS